MRTASFGSEISILNIYMYTKKCSLQLGSGLGLRSGVLPSFNEVPALAVLLAPLCRYFTGDGSSKLQLNPSVLVHQA